MKPRIRCYQWDDWSIWYKMPSGMVYRLDAFPCGEYKSRWHLASWLELLTYSVPYVGY